MAQLTIEIFSDVVCPWCFIGKRRLDQVLASMAGTQDFAIRWRPYQLAPNIPVGGIDRGEYLRRRYGPEADAGHVPERIAVEAEAEAIQMRYDLMQRMPNTLNAHRLMEHAATGSLQHALAERLFLAYFCNGEDVESPASLAAMAEEVGLGDAAEVQTLLEGDAFADEVQAQLARAPELGITGVPGYWLADAFLLPGAQSAEVMGQIFERVASRIAR